MVRGAGEWTVIGKESDLLLAATPLSDVSRYPTTDSTVQWRRARERTAFHTTSFTVPIAKNSSPANARWTSLGELRHIAIEVKD